MGLLATVGKWFSRSVSVDQSTGKVVNYPSGSRTDAGVAINERNALKSSPVWSAVRVISEGISCLPLHLYRAMERGSTKATDHPLYYLLHSAPNKYTSSMRFRETSLAHALLWGNGYAEIVRNGTRDRVMELVLLHPGKVEPKYKPDGTPFYRVYADAGRYRDLAFEDVFHLAGLGFDGLKGYSVVEMARNSLGLTAAAEKFGSRFFNNGAKPTGTVDLQGTLDDEAFARFKREFNEQYSGTDKAGSVILLEGGAKFTPISIPPDDAQFLQTRTFQVEEVARWFNIPVSKLRATGQKSYATLEQENQAFWAETLLPWIVRFEQEIELKLLAPQERGRLYAKFQPAGVLRADLATRYNSYAIGINWGFLSPNDARVLEDLDPIPDGDVYMRPLNMQPINAPNGPSAPTTTPAVGAAPTGVPTTGTPSGPTAGGDK
jgi:HK97 family phage portal protein